MLLKRVFNVFRSVLGLFWAVFSLDGFAQPEVPRVEWVKHVSAEGWIRSNSVITDLDENVYSTGGFFGSMDFAGNLLHADGGGFFLSKMNGQGEYQWIRHFEGSAEGVSLALDSFGNIYVCGTFRTIDLENTTMNTKGSDENVFIARFDQRGDMIWIKRFGASYYTSVQDIAWDDLGYIYIVGSFQGKNLQYENESYVLDAVGGKSDAYILKIDLDGNFLWSRRIGGGEGWDTINSVVVDRENNFIIMGNSDGAFQLEGENGFKIFSPAGGHDIFISKLNPEGKCIWIKQFGGSGSDAARGITTDVDGNIYGAGVFSGEVVFSEGFSSARSEGDWDVIILRLDTNGDLDWVRVFGGQKSDHVSSICIDNEGYLYVAGLFSDTVNFDVNDDTFKYSATGLSDIFISKFSNDGDCQWVYALGGELAVWEGNSTIAVDVFGSLFVTAVFGNTVNIDKGGESLTLTALNEYNVIVLKMSQEIITNTLTAFMDDAISVYPNPAGDFIQVKNVIPGSRLKVTDMSGKELITVLVGNSFQMIDISGLSNGLYLIQTEKNDVIYRDRLVINK